MFMKRDRQTTIRISEDALEALQELADSDSRPLAAYIRLVLERHIEQKTKPTKGKKPT